MQPTRLLRATPFLLGFAIAPGCAGGSKFGGLGATCPQLGSNVDPLTLTYSANAQANAKVRAFVAAAKSLVRVSLEMEALATESCQRMGADLGLAPAQMAPQNDEPGARTQAACGAVAAQIDGILRQGVQVSVRATPPQCQANLQAHAACEGTCSAEVDPGQIIAQCEPARLSGFCQGQCVGQCDGTCRGACQGQCSAVDASGQCAGGCQGTCQGSCDATCHARCEGQWQAPQCAGSVRPPSADAECNASCTAHANLNAQCTPAQVQVFTGQNAELAARLAATLQANLPQLLYAQIALGQRVLQDVQVVVDLGAALPRVIGNAGLEAMACVAAAAQGTVRASARLRVSVQASASVSGRVGAS